ncbi:hypothetical protein, partial [Polynucleobacter sp. JS-Polo-80-F4]|uniref:hypothetical protein n=1 Tax=Polynucleobacter sp. JS-Polo-80-F4 TaxID=2576918 RepID=UPI001C0DEF2F
MINPAGIFQSHTPDESYATFSTKIKQVFTVSFFLISFAQCIQAASPVPVANALPTNGQVIAGSASISQTQTPTSAAMTVNQTTQRAVVNWDS